MTPSMSIGFRAVLHEDVTTFPLLETMLGSSEEHSRRREQLPCLASRTREAKPLRSNRHRLRSKLRSRLRYSADRSEVR